MKYMPQEVFDYGALVLAKAVFSGNDALEIAQKLEAGYVNTYADTGLARQWLVAAQKLQDEVPKLFAGRTMSKSELGGICISLAHAIDKFHPDGKRKSKMFRGAWFGGEKKPIEDKASRTALTALVYHHAIMNGLIKADDLK